MAYKKGDPKIAGSGRVAGVPNKKTGDVAGAIKAANYGNFDPIIELMELHARLKKYRDENPARETEVADRLVNITKTLLPYMKSRKPQEIVQHNINTDEPDIVKARDAIMRAMTRLRDDPL